MPGLLPQTCFGSLVLLRNSRSRITGPSIRRHLGVVVRTTSITHSNIDSHRTYTSITPRSRHRYRVQPNHLTQQMEWQPTTTTSSERPPQSQPNLQDHFRNRERFARRRRKDEEPDRVRGGFMGMSWKASLSLFLLLLLPLHSSLSSSSSSLPLPSVSDYDYDYDYDRFPPGERFLI